jgi:molecular chaperone DnaK
MLRENGDKIGQAERASVENAIADAKSALTAGEKAGMDKAREALQAASHKLAEEMYKAATAAGAAPGTGAGDGAGHADGAHADGAASSKKDEGVIDAEYVDVEEKK